MKLNTFTPMNCFGISEFVGESGAGKTKLALSIEKDLKTLYLSIDSSGIPPLLSNVIPIRIKTFLELKIFMAQEIKRAVKALEIKKIILDGLENYLYGTEQPRKESNDIFRIIKVLKYLCFVKGIRIIVINGSYGQWSNDNVKIANKYFGLPWEYMINSRFLITRHNNYRTVCEIKESSSGSCELFKFKLCDFTIEII